MSTLPPNVQHTKEPAYVYIFAAIGVIGILVFIAEILFFATLLF